MQLYRNLAICCEFTVYLTLGYLLTFVVIGTNTQTTVIPENQSSTVSPQNKNASNATSKGPPKLKIADANTPANGPFALKDAPPNEDGVIEQRAITAEWFILRKRMTWGQAVEACENASAHLVVLPNEEQAKKLVEAIATSVTEKFDPIAEYARKYQSVEFGPDRRYWVGLTDQVQEGEWMWAKHGLELLYDFWYPGQPDHGRADAKYKSEHCAVLWNPGYYRATRNTHMFNDVSCSLQYYPICGTGRPTY